ncbi:uncharacterized protein VTP21DRAFT_11598 [Calcarisporiella thermophila]|uniref:uncharacterized protein n=1 Tax=Calcarisporiella thermophila TaxID=911321 RepID=UPI003743E108
MRLSLASFGLVLAGITGISAHGHHHESLAEIIRRERRQAWGTILENQQIGKDNGITVRNPDFNVGDPDDKFPMRPRGEWDIKTNHPKKIRFTTDEGTWMNVDVRPDGKELVFDLLGDLYTLPIKGGKAKLLKGGVPFDTQPRYSPDGNHVIFRSDQSGCDNVWLLSRDGGKARPLTNEPYRHVNNAMFHPKGKEFVAVKWYMSGRSLGAGELWQYKIGDGASSGKRLLARVNAQIGNEEPVYHPQNPNIIFFSKNVKDGSTWEYDKNPHDQIYQILAIDQHSNATAKIAGGVGGAARPVVSHDGEWLAFIRTKEFRHALILHNLHNHEEKILWDGLSSDNQMVAAVRVVLASGVYPSFAFLPDDSAIIIWAKGKLWRVPVDSKHGHPTIIPFTADVELNLAPTVRKHLSIVKAETKDSFKAKALSFLSVSADGSIAMNAAGRTFVQRLPGKPHAVGGSVDNVHVRHYHASFHHSDPNLLILCAWDDQTYSKIQIVNLKSGKVVDLKLPPGRYQYPSLSPSTKKVAFVRADGDTLTGSIKHIGDAGLYVADLDDSLQVKKGSLKRLTRSAYDVFRFYDSEEVLYADGDAGEVATLHLESGKQTLLAQCMDCTEARRSPDGKHTAFVTYREVYIVPTESLGKKVFWTKPGVAPPKTVRVSFGGGHDIHWSRDSSILYYLNGAKLNSIEVEDAIGCANDADLNFGLSCAKKKVKKHTIEIVLPTEQSRIRKESDGRALVLDNATLITMQKGTESSDKISNGRIVVEGGKIVSVGKRDEVKLPKGAHVVDLKGHTVLPGFIDAHAHWSMSTYPLGNNWQFHAALAYGVTSMHNPSADTVLSFTQRETTLSGRALSPRLFSTGTILYGAEGGYRCEVNTLDDAISFLKNIKEHGGFSVKSYNQPCRAARQMILEAARHLGMSVVPEGGMQTWWNQNHVIDGHTTVEHNLPVTLLYNDIVKLWGASGTAWTPTMLVLYGGISGKKYWYQHTKVYEDKRLRNFNPHAALEQNYFRWQGADDRDYKHFEAAQSVRKMIKAGVKVQVGAHGEQHGVGYHWEMWMFQQGNLTNYEVFRAATRDAAQGLGLGGIGRIQEGYAADFVVYPPGDNLLKGSLVQRSDKIKYVIKGGRVFEAFNLVEHWPVKGRKYPLPTLNAPQVFFAKNVPQTTPGLHGHLGDEL